MTFYMLIEFKNCSLKKMVDTTLRIKSVRNIMGQHSKVRNACHNIQFKYYPCTDHIPDDYGMIGMPTKFISICNTLEFK